MRDDSQVGALGEQLPRFVELDAIELHHGAGCHNCNDTGYVGRLGAYELLVTNDEIRSMLMQGESTAALKRTARIYGMASMRDDAWRKALNGITTVEEVNRSTRLDEPLNEEELKKMAEAQLAAATA